MGEAAKRGLPNLNTTPLAVATFNSAKAKKLFSDMGIFSAEEVDARAEVMFENYTTTLSVEVETLIDMIETGILPACAKDMAKYQSMPALAGDREATYKSIEAETDKLKGLFVKKPHELKAEATYLCDTIKPQMVAIRALVDKAEGLLEAGLYPYPTYEELIYSHHSRALHLQVAAGCLVSLPGRKPARLDTTLFLAARLGNICARRLFAGVEPL